MAAKYGAATVRQLRKIQHLIGPVDVATFNQTLRDHGASDADVKAGLARMSKAAASYIIGSLIRNGHQAAAPDAFDPGELAADRWNETQVAS